VLGTLGGYCSEVLLYVRLFQSLHLPRGKRLFPSSRVSVTLKKQQVKKRKEI